MHKPTFADFVTCLRERADLGKAELAERLGISRISVLKWESGQTQNPRLEHLRGLRDIFGLSGDDILDFRIPAKAAEDRATYPLMRVIPMPVSPRDRWLADLAALTDETDDYGLVALLEKARELAKAYPLKKSDAS